MIEKTNIKTKTHIVILNFYIYKSSLLQQYNNYNVNYFNNNSHFHIIFIQNILMPFSKSLYTNWQFLGIQIISIKLK